MAFSTGLGAYRDRTNLFISYRQSYPHHPQPTTSNTAHFSSRFDDRNGDSSERAGLMANQPDDAVIEMDLLPPRWLDIQDEVSSILATATTQMKQLDTLHAKHVLPGFDDESVKAREERSIETLTQDITRAFGTCQARIRRIDALLREQAVSDADATMAKNLQISLATKVGEVSTVFRKKQAAYLKKLRALGGMGTPSLERSSTPTAQNPYTDPAMQDNASDLSSAQSTLLQTAQVRRRAGLQDATIAQREREIEKIAQGVIDLSTMFQELNSMVIDQGSLLDRIDYNVERTAEHTKAAEKELTVATGYQKKSTKRKILLLLVLLVAGMFILLLIKPRRSSGSTPAPPPPPPVVDVPKVGEPAGGPPPQSVRPRHHDSLSSGNKRTPAQSLGEWKQRRRRPPHGSSLMAL